MADNKFQVIKRSISNWSLSTIKKPSISGPKLKRPRLKIFGGKKKNRQNDGEVATTGEEAQSQSASHTINEPTEPEGNIVVQPSNSSIPAKELGLSTKPATGNEEATTHPAQRTAENAAAITQPVENSAVIPVTTHLVENDCVNLGTAMQSAVNAAVNQETTSQPNENATVHSGTSTQLVERASVTPGTTMQHVEHATVIRGPVKLPVESATMNPGTIHSKVIKSCLTDDNDISNSKLQKSSTNAEKEHYSEEINTQDECFASLNLEFDPESGCTDDSLSNDEISINILRRALASDDIRYIDDNVMDDDTEENSKVQTDSAEGEKIPITILDINHSNCSNLQSDASVDGSYSWWDAQGTLTPSNQQLQTHDLTNEEYENYMASEFYDASESRTLTPASEKSYEDVLMSPDGIGLPGSAKAREWVKSYNEDAAKRAEESMMSESSKADSLPRSRSALEISKEKIWNKRDEIVLNSGETAAKTAATQNAKPTFLKFFTREKVKKHEPESSSKSISKINKPDKEKVKIESLKNIFRIRKNLSIKSPFVDVKGLEYKETDIYIASTPYALADTVRSKESQIEGDSKGSLDITDDGIICPSMSDEVEIRDVQAISDTNDLEREIEKYLPECANRKSRMQSSSEEETNQKSNNYNTSQSKIISYDDDIDSMKLKETATYQAAETNSDNNHQNDTRMTAPSAANADKSEHQDPVKFSPAEVLSDNKQFHDSKESSDAISHVDNGISNFRISESAASCQIKNSQNDDSKDVVSSVFLISDDQSNCSTEPLSVPVADDQLQDSRKLITAYDTVQYQDFKGTENELVASNESSHADDGRLEVHIQGNQNFKDCLPATGPSALGNKMRVNPQFNLTKTFKNLKENIFSADTKEKIKTKKIKEKLTSLGKKRKNISSKTWKQNRETDETMPLLSPNQDTTSKECNSRGSSLEELAIKKNESTSNENSAWKENAYLEKSDNEKRKMECIAQTEEAETGRAGPKLEKTSGYEMDAETNAEVIKSIDDVQGYISKSERNHRCETTTHSAINVEITNEKHISDSKLEIHRCAVDIETNNSAAVISDNELRSDSTLQKSHKFEMDIVATTDAVSNDANSLASDCNAVATDNNSVSTDTNNVATGTNAVITNNDYHSSEAKLEGNQNCETETDTNMVIISDDIQIPIVESDSTKSNSVIPTYSTVDKIKSADKTTLYTTGSESEIRIKAKEYHSADTGAIINSNGTATCDAETKNLEDFTQGAALVNCHINNATNETIFSASLSNAVSVVDETPTFPVYQNEVFESDRVFLTRNVKNLPKPSPRTKKNRYGYSTVKEEEQNEKLEVTTESQSVQHAPVIIIDAEEPNNEKDEVLLKEQLRKRTRYTSENKREGSEVSEPIYWEIGESAPKPKPSPRKKKEKSRSQDLSVCKTRNGNRISNIKPLILKPKKEPVVIPDWIQQRPPIPSPRNKKQLSMQLLPTNSKHSTELSSTDTNIFANSFSNIEFQSQNTDVRKESMWSGEDFYSGKAASIAYGMTTQHEKDSPSVPTRVKKQSLTSLPGIVPSEEKILRKERIPFKTEKRARDIATKRERRRTAPEEVLQPTPCRENVRSPIQAMKDGLLYFTDILASVGTGVSLQKQTEELLSDVLFAVNSLMGQDTNGTWGLHAPHEQSGVEMTYVTLGQVKEHLQEAFQVSPEKLEQLLAEIQQRQVANVTLHMKIIEAKELRPKTVRGGSNPYVTVNIPNSRDSHRTRTEHETLSPKWNQDFSLSVKNLQNDVVQIQVWHDFDHKFSTHVGEVKDFESLTRLIKGTNAVAHKHEAHLLGSVEISIKDIKEHGIRNWFTLQKESQKGENKHRGLVHIEAEVRANNVDTTGIDRRSRYDALLARLVYYYIKSISNNNAEKEPYYIPWSGQLSPEAVAALAQHAIVLGLNNPLQNLSWWIVGSRVPTADTSWQLLQLQKVQKYLTENVYSGGDLDSFVDSCYGYIEYALHRLRNLRTSFPPSSGIIGKHQYTSMLQIIVSLETHSKSHELLDSNDITDLNSKVRAAVTDYVKTWWERLIEEQLRGIISPEDQIKRIIYITEDAYKILGEIAVFYSPSLIKEMNIPYFRETFLMITKELNPCVRPPLMNIYSHLRDMSDCRQDTADSGSEDNKLNFSLESGTLLWQLYVNVGRIQNLGKDLPKEVIEGSGLFQYHKWFNKGVRRWVELAKYRAITMIHKAVELDNFEPVDEYCNFSSSATDVIGIFTDVQIWWKNLSWPDPENSMVLLAKILEDICSYGMTYADLLNKKVGQMFSVQSNLEQSVLSKEICAGLNNIERVRNELTYLQQLFEVDRLSEKVRNSQTGGEDAANKFIKNVNTLIESSAENMEAKVNEFIEVVTEKINESLAAALTLACEESSSKPLLLEFLDPMLQGIHGNMNDSNFKRFLSRIWEALIYILKDIVTRNADKRKSSFFNGIYVILQASLEFFSPADGEGLSTTETTTSKDYLELMELLELLRLSTENLIANYYTERTEEQSIGRFPSTGELVVRAFFTRAGKMTVEVIMARDMQVQSECTSLSVISNLHSNHSHHSDAYVKVQFVPSDWFPGIHEVKTKTLKSDPAVFEEIFDFELKPEDNGVSTGCILFTVKEYRMGRPNIFIGEAFVALKDLPCVDSGETHSVQNTYLRLTTPALECGYHSLTALKLRISDRTATSFIKKITPRFSHEVKGRSTGGLLVVSSDDERPKSTGDRPKSVSPRLLHMMKFT